jgi:hypothetical protein
VGNELVEIDNGVGAGELSPEEPHAVSAPMSTRTASNRAVAWREQIDGMTSPADVRGTEIGIYKQVGGTPAPGRITVPIVICQIRAAVSTRSL